MRVTWYGHACFKLEGSGLAIVTDPYQLGAAFPVIRGRIDVVIRSSPDDPAHCNVGAVPGQPRLIEAIEVARTEPLRIDGTMVTALEVSEHIHREDARANAMYQFALDGVRVFHMGDIGNPFSEEHLHKLEGQVDVMLALTGGPPTIELSDLYAAIKRIQPRIVIPMHYRIDGLRTQIPIVGIDDFTMLFSPEQVVNAGSHTVEITTESLPDDLQVLVLEAALGGA
jgi:L-ascorbate metabolism protein UlaG (beta-lactamase superfamily)